jgi:phospho-N-acetylmuramoyl-pentapeptide-transferase
MGDTGSLALGGFASCNAVFSGNAFYIAIIGFPFVISVISVVVQVIYYKVTGGKRIFLMSPIHHHFQQKGYSETKIAYAYSMVSLFIALACILALIW